MSVSLNNVDFVWKGPRPADMNHNIFELILRTLYDASKHQYPGVENFLMRLEHTEDNANFDPSNPAILIVPFDNAAEFYSYITDLISCGVSIELFNA